MTVGGPASGWKREAGNQALFRGFGLEAAYDEDRFLYAAKR